MLLFDSFGVAVIDSGHNSFSKKKDSGHNVFGLRFIRGWLAVNFEVEEYIACVLLVYVSLCSFSSLFSCLPLQIL